jgi:hypothetical protein
MRVVQRERDIFDERLNQYFRRERDLDLRKGEGEEQRKLAAAMAAQEARIGIEVVGRLGRFSFDGDEGCSNEG